MNPRGKLVAAQAAAVTAVVVVVYVTLLRPEDPSSISGIEAPNGGPAPAPQVQAHNGPGGRPERPPVKRRRRGTQGGGAGAGGPGVGVVAGGPASARPAGSEPLPPTPPDDQYTDAVKALLDRVGGHRLPGQ